MDLLRSTAYTTGLFNFQWNVVVMWGVGCLFIYLAVAKKYEHRHPCPQVRGRLRGPYGPLVKYVSLRKDYILVC